MNILARFFSRRNKPILIPNEQHGISNQPISFLPAGEIEDWYSHAFLKSIARNWQEAKIRLYNGLFADVLNKAQRVDWEKHARTIVASQPDQDVGLFSFAVMISLSSGKHVNTHDMLKVAKAAAQTMIGNKDRIQQLLNVVPASVRVYQEDDDRQGFFYDEKNEAHSYLVSLLRESWMPDQEDSRY